MFGVKRSARTVSLSPREADRVCAVLGENFELTAPELDAINATLRKDRETRKLASFEVIVDHPASAMYRLKWSSEGLRVSYYSMFDYNPDHPGEVRARELTAAVREAAGQ